MEKKERKYVIIVKSPVTERMVRADDKGMIEGDSIRVGGNWFPLNNQWEYSESSD